MRFDQLEHAIRAACDVSRDQELYIFGSQAILGSFPDAPESLRGSIEVDLQPKNLPDAVDLIDGALGELSPFHEMNGFYVHGVSIEHATLPVGWEARTVRITDPVRTRGAVGLCVEGHDLAASKLHAFRDKDREFVRTLLAERMLVADTLMARIGELPTSEADRERLLRWVRLTAGALDADGG